MVTDRISVRPLLGGQLAWLTARGWNVGVICGSQDQELADVGQAQVNIVKMRRSMSVVGDIVTLYRLAKKLKELRPLIVNAGTPKAGLLGMLASWFVGVPVRVYCLRGLRLETTWGLKRALLTLTEKVACLCAHKVICVSHSLRQKVLHLGLTGAEKIVVIGSGSSAGVDVERFGKSTESYSRAAELRCNLNIPPGAPVIGYIGRLTRDKGIVELIEAFEAVLTELKDARLLLVGAFEESDAVPARTRKAISTNPFIHHVGWVVSTTDYLHAVDVIALPTYREGFPNIALEAAAAEKPIVSTHATGVIDAVVDGITGLLSPVGDPLPLAANLVKLLTQKRLAKSMGRAARKRVEAEFSKERVCTELELFYLTLCQERGLRIPTPYRVQHEVRFRCSKICD